MLIAFTFLAFIFILGLITTKFINYPISNIADGFMSLPNDNRKAMVMKSTSSSGISTTSGHGKSKLNSELESVFATFDKNHDGYITNQELKESFENIGMAMSDSDVKETVDRVDANGDGLIDLDEFCELFEPMTKGGDGGDEEVEVEEKNGRVVYDGGEYLKEAFDVFDGDGDGVITVDELGMVLSSLGFKEGKVLENCKEMIGKVDIDGDGMINFDEFKMMMSSGKSLIPAF